MGIGTQGEPLPELCVLVRYYNGAAPSVARALAQADRKAAAEILLDRLQGEPSATEARLLSLTLSALSPWRCTEQLEGIAHDQARDVRARRVTTLVLRSMGVAMRFPLQAIDLELFAAQESLDQLSRALLPTDEGGFAALLDSTPRAWRGALLASLEEARSQLMLPVLPFYRDAFLLPAEAIGEVCAGLLADGTPEALGALQRLYDETDEPAASHALGQALIRLRTRLLAPHHGRARRMHGEALLSAPDPSGRYALFVQRQHSEHVDILLSVEINPDGWLEHARVVASLASERHRCRARFTRKHRGATVSLSLGEVSAMAARIQVEPGYRRDDVSMAALLLCAAPPSLPIADEPPLPPTAAPHLALADVLVRHALHRWTLDEERESPRARLAHALRLLAHWLRLKRDPTAAHVALAAADEVSERGVSSEVRAMLIERQEAIEPAPPSEAPVSEDRNLQRRRLLRARFFSSLTQPLGRDLALLDLSVETWRLLDLAAPTPLGDHAAWAYSIAQAFMQSIEQRGHNKPLRKRGSTALQLPAEVMAEVDESHRSFVHRVLAAQLDRFIERVCGRCPMTCFSLLEERVGEVFFAQQHPSQQSFTSAPVERLILRR